MAGGQYDVDVPANLLGAVGTLLSGFRVFLATKGYKSEVVAKEPGNHATPWWLYAGMVRGTMMGKVQYGETKHASVNATPHMYVRARRQLTDNALCLLHEYIDEAGAAGAPAALLWVPPPPARPPPRFVAKAHFDGTAYGPDYLCLEKGDEIVPCQHPVGVAPEGWFFGESPRGGRGWYPPTFVADVSAELLFAVL